MQRHLAARVEDRLSGWMARPLSMAGRAVLATSVQLYFRALLVHCSLSTPIAAFSRRESFSFLPGEGSSFGSLGGCR